MCSPLWALLKHGVWRGLDGGHHQGLVLNAVPGLGLRRPGLTIYPGKIFRHQILYSYIFAGVINVLGLKDKNISVTFILFFKTNPDLIP